MSMPDLAIVIVTYNARRDVERCLTSLHAHPPALPHEIVVVDNASADGTADALRAGWPRLRVIEAGGNVGFARATNLGIRASEGGLVLLLNPDTVVPAGALDALAARLLADDRVAIAGPRLVDAEGRPELSFGAALGPLAELRRTILTRLYARRTRGVPRYVAALTARERFPDWVSGACLLVRRRDADAVGLLDERYFMYEEDVDFCAAVRARGRLVLYTPAAEVIHFRGRSVAAAPAAAGAAYRRSQLAFYAKHRPRWLPALRLYLRLRGLLP